MERTLERLLQIQAAMEELAGALEQAEGVRDAWEPVGDLFIDSLQDHIDATKVNTTKHPAVHIFFLSIHVGFRNIILKSDMNWFYLQSCLLLSLAEMASSYS